VLKLDANRDFLWADKIHGLWNSELATYGTDCYLTGHYRETVAFGDFTVSSVPDASGGQTTTDIAVAKLDLAGEFQWVASMGGQGDDYGSDIAVNTLGIFSTGSFEGTADFDPGPGTYELTSTGGRNGYVLNLTETTAPASPTIESLSASPDPLEVGQTLTLTANNVVAGSADISRVDFYRDSNGNETYDAGTDEHLGADLDPAGGWSVDVVDTSDWSLGTHTLFALATDVDGRGSNVVSTAVEVTTGGGPGVTIYPSADVPKKISDLRTITSTINVSDSYAIGDLNVQVNITHLRDTDLDVFLIAPDRTTRVELFTDVGGNGQDFTDTILDSEAATSIVDGSAPFVGSYRPEAETTDDLTAVSGTNVQGVWTLEITDDYRRSVNKRDKTDGKLNSWSIEVTSQQTAGSSGAANSSSAAAADLALLAWGDPDSSDDDEGILAEALVGDLMLFE
jgi:subtilisin-like proprotein convertase family protein